MRLFKRSNRKTANTKTIKTNRGCRSAALLNLKQCLEIRGNQYRSRDNSIDYEAAEVEARLRYLESRKDERENRKIIKQYANEEAAASPVTTRVSEKSEIVGLVTEIRDYWKIVKPNGFSYELVEIPPQIMNF